MNEYGNPWNPSAGTSVIQDGTAVSTFMRGVYAWMFGGLLLTGLVAWGTAATPEVFKLIVMNRWIFYGLILAEFGLVMAISGLIRRLSMPVAASLFLLYSLLNGLTLSVIFLAYTATSIQLAFFTAAGTFGAMSLYGTLTKRRLDGLGTFAFMGLIGIILAALVNIFLKSSFLDFLISACGVVVFTGLTAYDTRKLRLMAAESPVGMGVSTLSIQGALTLYLDFINLFLMLLRLFGGRRD